MRLEAGEMEFGAWTRLCYRSAKLPLSTPIQYLFTKTSSTFDIRSGNLQSTYRSGKVFLDCGGSNFRIYQTKSLSLQFQFIRASIL